MVSVNEKMTKAKAKLVMNHPFFAHIALGLPVIEAEWLNPPTMMTDMKTIYFHPAFVEKHTVTELTGVLAHEVLHVALMHGTRHNNRDPKVWNYACDYAVNPICMDAGLTLPKPHLFEEKYRDMTAQAIYEDLMKNAIKITLQMPGMSGEGSGEGNPDGSDTLWGVVINPKNDDGSDMSEEQKKHLEAEIKVKVQAAVAHAEGIGKLPKGFEGYVKAMKKPIIDWKSYIQIWVKGHTPDNYTWARPNRSLMANYGIYAPRIQFNGAGIGVLSIDSSGSVSDGELVKYVNEIAGMIELCMPEKLIIIQHDSQINGIDEWEAGMDFNGIKIKGRGGTCIRPVFQKIKELDDDIKWMICFTDMGINDYPTDPADQPDYPVLWCATGPDNAPFGTYLPLRDPMDG